MKKYRHTASFLCGILLIAAIPCASIGANSINELKNQQAAVDQKASELEEKKTEMEQALAGLNSELYGLTMALNETSAELEEYRNQVEETSAELEEANLLAEQHYEGMKERIRFFYENNNVTAATAFIRSGNIIDFVNSVSMISEFTLYDRRKLKEYQDNQILIKTKLKELEEQQLILSNKENNFIDQQTELLAKISEQQSNINDAREDLDEQRQMSADLQQKINTMIAYEQLYAAQNDPKADTYYQRATQGGYYAGSSNITYHGAINYTQQEFDILSALIYCEAGGEPYQVQLAVGSVVMNRLRSSLFPDTLLGVIYQHKQFTPVLTGRHAVVLEKNLTTDSCRNAARYVLDGNSTGDWLFFRVDKEHKINGTHMGVSVFY